MNILTLWGCGVKEQASEADEVAASAQPKHEELREFATLFAPTFQETSDIVLPNRQNLSVAYPANRYQNINGGIFQGDTRHLNTRVSVHTISNTSCVVMAPTNIWEKKLPYQLYSDRPTIQRLSTAYLAYNDYVVGENKSDVVIEFVTYNTDATSTQIVVNVFVENDRGTDLVMIDEKHYQKIYHGEVRFQDLSIDHEQEIDITAHQECMLRCLENMGLHIAVDQNGEWVSYTTHPQVISR